MTEKIVTVMAPCSKCYKMRQCQLVDGKMVCLDCHMKDNPFLSALKDGPLGDIFGNFGGSE